MFAGKKSAQIREILISESAWEEMTCLFAPSLGKRFIMVLFLTAVVALIFLALLFFAEHYNIVSGGISLFIVLVIVWFFQPPVITYKAWRYRKKYISSGQTH